jgi:hypothetical protein
VTKKAALTKGLATPTTTTFNHEAINQPKVDEIK